MTPTTPGPVRRLVRYLAPPQLRVYAAFWAILVLAWVVATVIVDRVGTVDFSVYLVMGQGAPKVFLFVMSLIIAATGLPLYVGYGITRRHAFTAAAIILGGAGLLFAVLRLGVSLVEAAAYEATGLSAGLSGPLPVTSVTEAGWLVLTGTVVHILWAASGWIVGVGYYRFGPWLGTVLVTPASIPLVIGELAVPTERPGDGFVGLVGMSPAAVGPVVAAVAVLAVLVGYLVVRDLTIRKVSG